MVSSNKHNDPDWTLTVWVGGEPGASLEAATQNTRAYLDRCFQRHGDDKSVPRRLEALVMGASSTHRRGKGWQGVHEMPELDQVDSEGRLFKALQLRVSRSLVFTGPGLNTGMPMMGLSAARNLEDEVAAHGVKVLAIHGPRYCGTLYNTAPDPEENRRWNVGAIAPDTNGQAQHCFGVNSDRLLQLLRSSAQDLSPDAEFTQALKRALPQVGQELGQVGDPDPVGEPSFANLKPARSIDMEKWRAMRSSAEAGAGGPSPLPK